jgi:hypothetical protein
MHSHALFSLCDTVELREQSSTRRTGFLVSYTYEIVYETPHSAVLDAPRLFNFIPAIETAPNVNPFSHHH